MTFPAATQLQTTVTALAQKIMLVLPWQKSTNPMTAFCVAQLADKRRTASMLNFGDAFVAHTRNSCADHFLESSLDWMLTIDDDMVVPFGNANWFNLVTGFNIPKPFADFNAIDRLLSHKKTLVGGLYFGKGPDAPAMYNEGGTKGTDIQLARKAPMELVKPTRWVGTGCMLIHRSVFLDIERKFPRLARGANGRGGQWFSTSEHSLLDHMDRIKTMLATGPMTSEKAMKAYEMADAALVDARTNSSLGMGEDVQFCVRARQAGHQPYVDFGLRCGHAGTRIF